MSHDIGSTFPIDELPKHAPSWDSRRNAINKWFLDNEAEHLSEMYLAAIFHLEHVFMHGRGVVVAHAIREIGGRLPDIILQETTARVIYSEEIEKLRNAANDLSIFSQDAMDIDFAETQTHKEVHLLISKVNLLFEKHGSGENLRAKITRLFGALSSESDSDPDPPTALITRFFNLLRWAPKAAHLGKQKKDPEFWADLEDRFEEFESILNAMFAGFFATMDELDEILAKANT